MFMPPVQHSMPDWMLDRMIAAFLYGQCKRADGKWHAKCVERMWTILRVFHSRTYSNCYVPIACRLPFIFRGIRLSVVQTDNESGNRGHRTGKRRSKWAQAIVYTFRCYRFQAASVSGTTEEEREKTLPRTDILRILLLNHMIYVTMSHMDD